MNRTAAHFFTRLHSRKWRTHYSDEFQALLLDVPLSVQVVADVALSICASRRRDVNVTAVAIAIVFASLMFVPHRHATATTTIMQTVPRVSAHIAPPCRTYSSVARNEFVQLHRCLD